MSDAKTCPDCGHKHEGPRLANICIGCPCERRDLGSPDRVVYGLPAPEPPIDRCEGCGEVACECLKECAHGNTWDDCRACSLGLDDVASAASARTVRLVPDLFDDDAPVETWAFQWKRLVEADPSTLTAGGRRRRDAMLAIAAHINARGAHIEEAARAVVSADEWYCNAVDTGGDSDEAAFACSDTIARLSMAIDETKPPTRRPAAVDAWRNVPGHDRDDLLDWLDGVHRSGMRGESLSPTAHVAVRALLALAREVGGSER